MNDPTPARADNLRGPFGTEAEALAVAGGLLGGYQLPETDAAYRVLMDTLASAGAAAGQFDGEVIAHLAQVLSPAAVASLAGLIRRAAHGRPA